MYAVFGREELGVPPIPESFRPRLKRVARWAYSTRDISPLEMYTFDRYLYEATVEWEEDYVAVCHSGYGANSYAVTYHYVRGPLALFAQSSFGGIYEDRVQDAAQVRAMFHACAELIEIADRAPERPHSRLVVQHSNFRRTAWCEWWTFPANGTDPPRTGKGLRLAEDPAAAFSIVASMLSSDY